MQPLARMFSLLLLIVLGFSLAQAQPADDGPPLMAALTTHDVPFVHYDLYQYTTDQWQSVTEGGFKGGFSLSPDGGLVAYLTVPDFLREADVQGEEDVSFLLGSVWNMTLLDLATGEAREIAGQPPNIELSQQQIDNGTERSLPVWSPNGSAIAWTEQDYPEQSGVARLVVYNLAAGETRVLDDALPQMTMSSDGLPSFVSWGEPGIAVFTNDPNTNDETFHLYDPVTGTMQLVQMYFSDFSPWLPGSSPLWVNAGVDQVLAVQVQGPFWSRIDPVSGTATTMMNQLDFVSAVNPSSLRLQWNVQAYTNDTEWQLVDAKGAVLGSWLQNSLRGFVLSPSGQAAAYLEDDGVYLWENGSATELTLPEGMEVWNLSWGSLSVQFGAEYSGVG